VGASKRQHLLDLHDVIPLPAMTQQIDATRFKRATVNLKKVAIFLALIGLTLLYLGWIRYPLGEASLVREMVWVLRITPIVISMGRSPKRRTMRAITSKTARVSPKAMRKGTVKTQSRTRLTRPPYDIGRCRACSRSRTQGSGPHWVPDSAHGSPVPA